MSEKENRVYELSMKVLCGQLSIVEFSTLIGKSYRQCQRIISDIRGTGVMGAIHGNRGKSPWNRTRVECEQDILKLLKSKYYDFNLTHFREKLVEVEGLRVGKNVVHRLAKANNLVKRPKRRKSSKVHRLRPRMPQAGLLVQFDGSEHVWFGNLESDLIGAIDDATGLVLGAEFFPGETSLHCMKVMKDIFIEYGCPKAMYLDQAGYFGKDDREQSCTQIGRALEELGVEIILARSPQAKGKIERLWGTFQDRLIPELRLNHIKSIPQANEYLKNIFIPQYNRKFAYEARDSQSAFKPLLDPQGIDSILCTKYRRKIGSGNCFSWNNQRYIINSKYNYRFRSITISEHYDGTTTFDILGRKVDAAKDMSTKNIKMAA